MHTKAIVIFNNSGDIKSKLYFGEDKRFAQQLNSLIRIEDLEIECLQNLFKSKTFIYNSQYFEIPKLGNHYFGLCYSIDQQYNTLQIYDRNEGKQSSFFPIFQQLEAVEQVQNPILITDSEATILYVNSAWMKMTGYPLEEVLGKNPSQVVQSGEMDKDFYKRMWGTLLKDNIWTGRITNKRKNGHHYIEEMTITPYKSKLDNKKYYIAIKEDITLKSRMQESLLKEQSRVLFDQAPMINMILNREGIIEDINSNGAQLLGYQRDKLKGINWFDTFVPENQINQAKEKLKAILNKEENFDAKYASDSIVKDGSTKHFLWYYQTLSNDKGIQNAVFCTGVDITEMQRYNQLIQKQNKLLDISDQINQQSNSNSSLEDIISHSLKKLQLYDDVEGSWLFIHDKIEGLRKHFYSHGLEHEVFKGAYYDFLKKNKDVDLPCKHENLSETFIYPDQEISCKSCPVYKAEQSKIAFSGNLLHEGNKYGTITLLFKDDIVLDHSLIKLLNHIISKIGIELYNYILLKQEKAQVHQLQESEERFSAIVNNSTQGIIIIDSNFQFEYGNQSACEILEIPKNQFVGFEIKQLFSSEELELVQNIFLKRQNGGEAPKRYITTITTPLGNPKTLNVSSQIISINNETKTLTIINDITEEIATQEELSKSEEKYREFFEKDLSADYVSTPQGQILDCNPAFVKLFKFKDKLDALNAAPVDLYVSISERSDFLAALRKNRYIQNQEKQYKTKSGEIFFVLENTVGIFNEAGELIRIQGFMVDITEQKNKESKLQIALKKAKEADQLKSAFLNNISHEVRTPMNHIIGFSQILSDPNLDDDLKKSAIETIDKSAHELNKMIFDIIELSKVDTGQLSLNPKWILVEKFFNSIEDETKNNESLQSKGLSFKLTHPDSTSKTIFIDEVKLKTILSNLINNAIKFTHKGGIEISYHLTKNQINIEVKDSGIGIKKHHQEIIFDRFRQVSYGNDRKYVGAGIGLAITRDYLDLMQGKIEVDSTFGLGSTFRVQIPIKIALSKELAENQFADQNIMSANKKHKILIAEDDEANYFLLTILLKKYDAELINAKDGIEALKMVEEQPDISIILMDLKMPNMDGYVAAKQIHTKYPDIPIIAQSAHALIGDREKALAAGCIDYISKPINHQKLKNVMDKYLKP